MQKLDFEDAWDKTIAPQDRARIKELFESTKSSSNGNITFNLISKAYNHRDDLLIMVLIHNFTDEPFSFENLEFAYTENSKPIAISHFSFPDLSLDAKSSMPWTFIFPKTVQKQRATMEEGQLFLQSYGK